MSYILDALKKAEQERKRGRTPDFMTEHEDRRDRPKGKLWLYAVLVLFVAAAGSVGWFVGSDMYSGVTAKTQQPAQVTINPPAQLPSSAPPSAAPSSENPAAAPQAKIAETATPAKEVTTQTERREAAVKQDAGTSRSDKNSAAKKTAPSTVPGSPSKQSPDAMEPTLAKKPVPGNKIYTVPELPDEIRQGLPALSISTHIYSPEKSERLASINGHIGREGQEIMSGITLDSITPDGAILRHQGYKFKVDLK